MNRQTSTNPAFIEDAAAREASFAAQASRLSNGIEARMLSIPSANPLSYEDLIAKRAMAEVSLRSWLYVPKSGPKSRPAVIITPGSGGVTLAILEHARGLTDAGIAALVVDPFGGRRVLDTIASQVQFSFAASTHDVFAAMRALRAETDIDGGRLGAMGYSRGGISVLQAAVLPLVRAVLGEGPPLLAVLAAWPWCGYQFSNPETAPTAVRFVVAQADDWVSPKQCQDYATAMRARNPNVSIRIEPNAHHGFGYGMPYCELPNAIKAFEAPIIYFDERGIPRDICSDKLLPGADDQAIMRMLGQFITRGTHVGAGPGQLEDFVADLTRFFSSELA